MDYLNAADNGRERLNQLYAEADAWRLARSVEAAERARAAESGSTGGSWIDPIRYGLGILSAIATVVFFTIR